MHRTNRLVSTHAPSPTRPTAGHDEQAEAGAGRPPIDYAPIRGAARTALVWLMDVARQHATEVDDAEAIDRVERAALATLEGVPACCRRSDQRASEEDALVVAGIMIEVFSIDFKIPGLDDVFGGMYSGIDWILRSNVGGERPPVVVCRAGHAMRRHGGVMSAVQGVATRLGRGPRVAHGDEDDEPTHTRTRRHGR